MCTLQVKFSIINKKNILGCALLQKITVTWGGGGPRSLHSTVQLFYFKCYRIKMSADVFTDIFCECRYWPMQIISKCQILSCGINHWHKAVRHHYILLINSLLMFMDFKNAPVSQTEQYIFKYRPFLQKTFWLRKKK